VRGLQFRLAIAHTKVMDALPSTTVAAPPLPPMPKPLSRRMENYARCVAAGMSYAEAFRQAGCVASTAGSMSRQIGDMNRDPRVRARIAALRVKADEATVSTIAERMAWLRLIVTADPEELSRVVCDPCDLCWPDAEIARDTPRISRPRRSIPRPLAQPCQTPESPAQTVSVAAATALGG